MYDKRSTHMAELYYLDPLEKSNRKEMKAGFPAERNMGDTLLELINYANEKCPAEKHILVVYGHGSAFLGVAYDSGGEMVITPKKRKCQIICL